MFRVWGLHKYGAFFTLHDCNVFSQARTAGVCGGSLWKDLKNLGTIKSDVFHWFAVRAPRQNDLYFKYETVSSVILFAWNRRNITPITEQHIKKLKKTYRDPVLGLFSRLVWGSRTFWNRLYLTGLNGVILCWQYRRQEVVKLHLGYRVSDAARYVVTSCKCDRERSVILPLVFAVLLIPRRITC
jgi:hypothetical protein